VPCARSCREAEYHVADADLPLASRILKAVITHEMRPHRPMKIAIKLFAGLRDRAGTGDLSVELPEGATVRDAIEAAQHNAPKKWAAPTSLMAAVNNEYVEFTDTVADGDELALIPPVSGG